MEHVERSVVTEPEPTEEGMREAGMLLSALGYTHMQQRQVARKLDELHVWRAIGIELLRERYGGPEGVHVSKLAELSALLRVLPDSDEVLMAVVNWRPEPDGGAER